MYARWFQAPVDLPSLPDWIDEDVAGACALVTNLFHVSQALSWIAGTRNTIPERLEYVKAIPRLMQRLESLRSQDG
jgi:hypothetical protein